MIRVIRILNPKPCAECGRAADWEVDGKPLCFEHRHQALGRKEVKYA